MLLFSTTLICKKHHSNWVALDFGALQTKPKHLDCWIGLGVFLLGVSRMLALGFLDTAQEEETRGEGPILSVTC